MRAASSHVLIFFVGLALVHPAAAQSALDGPLAASSAASAPPASKPKPVHKKAAKTARRAWPQPVGPSYGATATPQAHPIVENRPRADDPFSLGMKWNGSNDSARETRIQNYGGDAPGTGAELGMKLHF